VVDHGQPSVLVSMERDLPLSLISAATDGLLGGAAAHLMDVDPDQVVQ